MKRLRHGLPLAVVLAAGAALWIRTAPPVRPAMDDPREQATYGDLAIDTASGPLKLSDLRGKGVVVYFGYASCPDICPTTLATMGQAFARLEPAQQDQLALVLVSVDPVRDTLPRLEEYARYFHPSFHGGSSSPAEVARMAADWGVVYRKVDTPGSAMGYTVDHSTQSFLVDRDGRMVREIPHGTPPSEVAAMLREVLDQSTD